MAVRTIIHKKDPAKLICVVSVYDDDEPVLEYINVGIDSTGNTTLVEEAIKEQLFAYRLNKLIEAKNPNIE
tara:strand:- start:101 stop:313 length:213 start_codon:yes stop_codon:yes gene_type:complete